VEDATGDSHMLDVEDDFEAFSNTKPNDHSTLVKVFKKNSLSKNNQVSNYSYIRTR